MREILFRGKDVHTKEWRYGSLLDFAGDGTYFLIVEPHISASTLPLYALVKDHAHFVVPETVGQYTGLKDKNGRRIFEGDIIDCWSEGVNAKGIVQQRNDGLWIIYPAWQKKIMWGLCPDEYGHTTVDVIGNIYDNPELMEGEK